MYKCLKYREVIFLDSVYRSCNYSRAHTVSMCCVIDAESSIGYIYTILVVSIESQQCCKVTLVSVECANPKYIISRNERCQMFYIQSSISNGGYGLSITSVNLWRYKEKKTLT